MNSCGNLLCRIVIWGHLYCFLRVIFKNFRVCFGLVLGNRIFLCGLNCPQILSPPASASPGLGWLACTITLGWNTQFFWMVFDQHLVISSKCSHWHLCFHPRLWLWALSRDTMAVRKGRWLHADPVLGSCWAVNYTPGNFPCSDSGMEMVGIALQDPWVVYLFLPHSNASSIFNSRSKWTSPGKECQLYSSLLLRACFGSYI